MMELFREDGCLTQYALDALVQGLPLDELSRLEIAEHLSFCDACVDRYSQALENCLLLAPEQPVAPSVMQRLRQRAIKVFFNKYTTVVAAASFAIVFWHIGVFNIDMSGESKMLNAMNQTLEQVNLRERASELANQISESVDAFFEHITFERSNN